MKNIIKIGKIVSDERGHQRFDNAQENLIITVELQKGVLTKYIISTSQGELEVRKVGGNSASMKIETISGNLIKIV